MSNVHAMKRKPHFLYKHDPFTYSSFMLFMVERLLKNESRKNVVHNGELGLCILYILRKVKSTECLIHMAIALFI